MIQIYAVIKKQEKKSESQPYLQLPVFLIKYLHCNLFKKGCGRPYILIQQLMYAQWGTIMVFED